MITKKTEYAIRALWELSQVGEELTTANLIALRQAIPSKYLPQIMSELSRAGLVSSSRGFGGGLKLSKSSKDIRILDVIEAIQGRMYLFECVAGQTDCQFYCKCGLKGVYKQAQEAMERVFANKRLSDLTFGPV